jgi:proteasome assembly chaperone (PAC2) family protein
MKIFEEISFSTPPVVLAAWPGMGNVGLIAVDFLRKKMNARLFAEIDMSPFFIPDSIVVKNGIAQFPDIPTSLFYYTKDPDLIIFESDAQVSGRDGIAVIKMFLDVITRFQVKRIFTFAAFAQPMSYRNPSQVLVAGNADTLLEKLSGIGVIPMPDGYIAGLNGLLLGVAASRKIEAGCLLGTIPSYAMNFAYPKASLELLRTVSGVLGFALDSAELDEGVGEMNQQLALIEEKIERLFNEARQNRIKATELKRELDRWNLFELYENRFLDLFEEDKKDRKK